MVKLPAASLAASQAVITDTGESWVLTIFTGSSSSVSRRASRISSARAGLEASTTSQPPTGSIHA